VPAAIFYKFCAKKRRKSKKKNHKQTLMVPGGRVFLRFFNTSTQQLFKEIRDSLRLNSLNNGQWFEQPKPHLNI